MEEKVTVAEMLTAPAAMREGGQRPSVWWTSGEDQAVAVEEMLVAETASAMVEMLMAPAAMTDDGQRPSVVDSR